MIHDFLSIGETVQGDHETIYFHIREDALVWRPVADFEKGLVIDELSYGFFRKAKAEPQVREKSEREDWWEIFDQLASYNGAGLEFMVQSEPGEPERLVILRVAFSRPGCFPPTINQAELVRALGGSATCIAHIKAGRP